MQPERGRAIRRPQGRPASLPFGAHLSTVQLVADITLYHFEDVLLTRLARPGVVCATIRDVVRHHADAEKRDLEQPRDLGGGCRLHLFGGRAELVVEALDAIQFAVPDLARTDHALDHASLVVL